MDNTNILYIIYNTNTVTDEIVIILLFDDKIKQYEYGTVK